MTTLLDRVRAATGPDRGLDGRIAWALGWRFNGFIWDGDAIGGPDTADDFDDFDNIGGSWKQPGDDYFFGDLESIDRSAHRKGEADGRWDAPPMWTASVDAILALIERKLPCNSTRFVIDPSGCSAQITYWPEGLSGERRVQSDEAQVTPALALCAAFLAAKEK